MTVQAKLAELLDKQSGMGWAMTFESTLVVFTTMTQAVA